MSRRLIVILSACGVALLLLVGAYFWLTRTLPVLTVATWSGAYGRAQANAMFRTYGDARSYDVRIALYDGGLGELQQMVGNRRYDWDVVDLELSWTVPLVATTRLSTKSTLPTLSNSFSLAVMSVRS